MQVRDTAMEELEYLNRALRTLSGCNRALLRANDETALLHDICRVVVDEAGYLMAWVGRAEHDEMKTLTPVADAGNDNYSDNLKSLNLTWADTARGSPLGIVIRTGNLSIIRDIQTDPGVAKLIESDPSIAAFHEKAIRRGHASVLILPLRVDDDVFGVISIAASEPNAFGDKEVELLSQASEDLAFGIEVLRARSRRLQSEREIRRLNRALRTRAGVAQAIAHASDETALLQEICRLVVEDCGYGLAWIGYVRDDGTNTLRLMAHTGFDQDFLELPGALDAMEHIGHFAAALNAGRPHVVRDIDALDPPLRDEAIKRGYHSAILLPWHANGEQVGTLHILAADADAFDDQEVELLAATTGDLGFGIAALRTRARALQAEATIRRMAYCDALTGLPNHVRLRELLEEALRAAKHERRPLGLLHVDVGRIRQIDESLGYREGDLLQQEIAAVLVQAVGAANTVARTGEGEFAVLMPSGGAEHASQLAQKILFALADPIELSGLFLEARANIGIALYPGHGTDPDALLHRARIALEPAKRSSIGYALFKGGLDQECSQSLSLMRDLRQALAHNELLLHYQPQLQIRTNRVRGAEALVRWQHPQHGLLAPESFIKLAESTGLITPLTYWVLDAALSQRYSWHQEGIERPVSVNLSARDLRDPMLLERVSGLFATWGAQADWIEFELTESALMEDPVTAMETLARLKDLDARLAIDDFGTGYSSLAYLQNLPVDTLKIDQSFVSRMTGNQGSAKIVRSVIDLAHALDLKVVAEGVEDRDTLNGLGALGCDCAQGYVISRPIPANQFSDWEAHSEWH